MSSIESKVKDLELGLACALEAIEEQKDQFTSVLKWARFYGWHESWKANNHTCPPDCGCDHNPAYLRGLAEGARVTLEERGWKRLAREVTAPA